MKYLLDTNICIYIIKRHPDFVLDKFKKFSPNEIGISSITLAELHFGVEKSQQPEKNRMALESFILPLEIFHFDDKAASCYGVLCSHLERKGTPIGPLDLMIAAHAQSLKINLVTNNVKEFSRVPHLIVENWAENERPPSVISKMKTE